MNTLMAKLSEASQQSHAQMYQNSVLEKNTKLSLEFIKSFVLKLIIKYFRQKISIYDKNKLLYELESKQVNQSSSNVNNNIPKIQQANNSRKNPPG